MLSHPHTLGSLSAILSFRAVLHNHLRHALASQCLAALELLPPEACESVEDGSEQQDNGSCDQTRRFCNDTQPLDE